MEGAGQSAARGSVQGAGPKPGCMASWPPPRLLACNRVERGALCTAWPISTCRPLILTPPRDLCPHSSRHTAGTRFSLCTATRSLRPANSSGPVGMPPREGSGGWRAGTVNRLWGQSRVRGACQLPGCRCSQHGRSQATAHVSQDTQPPCSAGPACEAPRASPGRTVTEQLLCARPPAGHGHSDQGQQAL